MTDLPMDASPDDLAEDLSDELLMPSAAAALPLEADPADVADQLAEIPDDDRY